MEGGSPEPPKEKFNKTKTEEVGSARGLLTTSPLALKSVEKQEIRWKGYIRKPVLDDIQQRPQTRLYTGAAVYNLPYLFVEPQDEGDEWVEVEVILRVIGSVEKD